MIFRGHFQTLVQDTSVCQLPVLDIRQYHHLPYSASLGEFSTRGSVPTFHGGHPMFSSKTLIAPTLAIAILVAPAFVTGVNSRTRDTSTAWSHWSGGRFLKELGVGTTDIPGDSAAILWWVAIT